MKRNVAIWICVVILFLLVNWMGIGSYYSGTAAHDLVGELESIYGEAYTGKAVEGGTQDMTFTIDSATFFPTNWNLRYTLGLDYHYTCTVTYTTYSQGSVVSVRTITYDGIDPMGQEHDRDHAYLDLDSKQEQ